MIEKELEKRHVPSFFEGITDKRAWEDKKNEIRELFLKHEYGFLPPPITPSVRIEKNWVDFAGKGKWESVFLTFEGDKASHTVRTDLILPPEKKNVPVFIYIGMNPEIPSKYLPVEEILDSGFGIYTFFYQDVTSDGSERDGLAGIFESCDCGKISFWAYMASRCMDYLEKRNEVDINNVAVIGHSRLGKTALWAGATDERFALVISNDSGCGGAALSRRRIGETLQAINRSFPHWFCENFHKYSANEDALPFDQHELIALIAPRPVYVASASQDLWADPKGEMLSLVHASPVYGLYGYDAFNAEELPQAFTPVWTDRMGYHLRDGKHDILLYDWMQFIAFADRFLK